MNLFLRDVILCLGAPLSGPEADLDRQVSAVRTDSRLVTPGDLFFCLKGERFDAHDFAPQVAAAGACAIVAARELPGLSCPVLVVDDTQAALGRLGRCWRERSNARVLGVTGTAGKTTVKELIAQTLAEALGQPGRVAKNHKNLNNQIGLPLSLLAADGDEAFWVMEAGISQPHDMAELGAILAPDLGLVLNVGPAHLSGLGSIAGVARAKASLLSFVRPGGLGLCSMDYPELWAEAQQVMPGVQGFSTRDAFARFYARFEEALPGGRGLFEIIVDGQAFWAELPACGAHFAENAAAVAGACTLLGLSADQISDGLGKAVLPDQRFRCACAGAWTVIDDTYNANPLSMRRSIEAARALAGEGKLVLVLGDMKELGEDARQAHLELGAAIAALQPALVCFQGEHAGDVAQGAQGVAVTPVTEPAQTLDALKGQGGGVVLVKGSRSCRMERHAQALLDAFGKGGGL